MRKVILSLFTSFTLMGSISFADESGLAEPWSLADFFHYNMSMCEMYKTGSLSKDELDAQIELNLINAQCLLLLKGDTEGSEAVKDLMINFGYQKYPAFSQ